MIIITITGCYGHIDGGGHTACPFICPENVFLTQNTSRSCLLCENGYFSIFGSSICFPKSSDSTVIPTTKPNFLLKPAEIRDYQQSVGPTLLSSTQSSTIQTTHSSALSNNQASSFITPLFTPTTVVRSILIIELPIEHSVNESLNNSTSPNNSNLSSLSQPEERSNENFFQPSLPPSLPSSLKFSSLFPIYSPIKSNHPANKEIQKSLAPKPLNYSETLLLVPKPLIPTISSVQNVNHSNVDPIAVSFQPSLEDVTSPSFYPLRYNIDNSTSNKVPSMISSIKPTSTKTYLFVYSNNDKSERIQLILIIVVASISLILCSTYVIYTYLVNHRSMVANSAVVPTVAECVNQSYEVLIFDTNKTSNFAESREEVKHDTHKILVAEEVVIPE
jgi:hypothetical protein